MEILLLILLVIVVPTAYASVIGAPPAPSRSSQIGDILELAGLKKNEMFYELGTGMGGVITAVAARGVASVVGFELSPLCYAVTWLRLRRGARSEWALHMRNFYRADIRDADVVFFFLMPRVMEKLKTVLLAQLKPGTRVVSYAFPIPGWNAVRVIHKEGEVPIYSYIVRPLGIEPRTFRLKADCSA